MPAFTNQNGILRPWAWCSRTWSIHCRSASARYRQGRFTVNLSGLPSCSPRSVVYPARNGTCSWQLRLMLGYSRSSTVTSGSSISSGVIHGLCSQIAGTGVRTSVTYSPGYVLCRLSTAAVIVRMSPGHRSALRISFFTIQVTPSIPPRRPIPYPGHASPTLSGCSAFAFSLRTHTDLRPTAQPALS